MVEAIAHSHVRCGDIAQGAHVGHQGSRQCVECHLLAVVGPEGVASDAHEQFVACHLLHDGTCLSALSGVDVALACILVGAIHATRHLPIALAHEEVVVVGGLQHERVAIIYKVGGRLAETLCHVHAVPVGQVVLQGPVNTAAVQLVDEWEDALVARLVVEPDHTPLIVAAALCLPEAFQEVLVGNGQLPMEVVGHRREHTLIARVLVIGLQRPEHRHLRP